MARQRYDAVVCGAGIAGIAAAHALREAGLARVALVEPGPVLGLTSDKSTECYRNWWPGPGDAMVALMNRSIDLMTEHARRSGNRFVMNRRGQVYATARPEVAEALDRRGHEAEELGASMLRVAISARDYVSAAA
jgi:glycine/D-amino acid oxidase-like deaminating enzyme